MVEPTQYVMLIQHWHWIYSFGINNMTRFSPGYYTDYRHLVAEGRLTVPSELSSAAVRLHLFPTDISNETSPLRTAPTRIGLMGRGRRAQRFEAYLPMPTDILPSLLPMLVAEKLRYVMLSGTPMLQGRAEIQSYQFNEVEAPKDSF